MQRWGDGSMGARRLRARLEVSGEPSRWAIAMKVQLEVVGAAVAELE
jgi:hypothetical protein